MLKLVQLVVFGTVLYALAFASSASAVGALGQIAGPLPIGMRSVLPSMAAACEQAVTQSG